MLIQELFRRVAADRSQVMQDITAILIPAILREFAAIPALGGSEKLRTVQEPELEELLEKIPAYTVEERQRFSAKGFDQSLSTHLINGLFAGMHLAERLPENKELDATGQQIWALGYIRCMIIQRHMVGKWVQDNLRSFASLYLGWEKNLNLVALWAIG